MENAQYEQRFPQSPPHNDNAFQSDDSLDSFLAEYDSWAQQDDNLSLAQYQYPPLQTATDAVPATQKNTTTVVAPTFASTPGHQNILEETANSVFGPTFTHKNTTATPLITSIAATEVYQEQQATLPPTSSPHDSNKSDSEDSVVTFADIFPDNEEPILDEKTCEISNTPTDLVQSVGGIPLVSRKTGHRINQVPTASSTNPTTTIPSTTSNSAENTNDNQIGNNIKATVYFLEKRLGFLIRFGQNHELIGRVVHVSVGNIGGRFPLNILVEYPIKQGIIWTRPSGATSQMSLDCSLLREKMVPFHTRQDSVSCPAFTSAQYLGADEKWRLLGKILPKQVRKGSISIKQLPPLEEGKNKQKVTLEHFAPEINTDWQPIIIGSTRSKLLTGVQHLIQLFPNHQIPIEKKYKKFKKEYDTAALIVKQSKNSKIPRQNLKRKKPETSQSGSNKKRKLSKKKAKVTTNKAEDIFNESNCAKTTAKQSNHYGTIVYRKSIDQTKVPLLFNAVPITTKNQKSKSRLKRLLLVNQTSDRAYSEKQHRYVFDNEELEHLEYGKHQIVTPYAVNPTTVLPRVVTTKLQHCFNCHNPVNCLSQNELLQTTEKSDKDLKQLTPCNGFVCPLGTVYNESVSTVFPSHHVWCTLCLVKYCIHHLTNACTSSSMPIPCPGTYRMRMDIETTVGQPTTSADMDFCCDFRIPRAFVLYLVDSLEENLIPLPDYTVTGMDKKQYFRWLIEQSETIHFNNLLQVRLPWRMTLTCPNPNCGTPLVFDRKQQGIPLSVTCVHPHCGYRFCTGCYQQVEADAEEKHIGTPVDPMKTCYKYYHYKWELDDESYVQRISQQKFYTMARLNQVDVQQRLAEVIFVAYRYGMHQTCPTCLAQVRLDQPNLSLQLSLADGKQICTTHIINCPCRVPWCYICQKILPITTIHQDHLQQGPVPFVNYSHRKSENYCFSRHNDYWLTDEDGERKPEPYIPYDQRNTQCPMLIEHLSHCNKVFPNDFQGAVNMFHIIKTIDCLDRIRKRCNFRLFAFALNRIDPNIKTFCEKYVYP